MSMQNVLALKMQKCNNKKKKKKKIPEFFFGGYKQFNLGTVQEAVYVFLHIPTLIFVSAPQTLTNVLNSVTF